jgi:hypothetical protein
MKKVTMPFIMVFLSSLSGFAYALEMSGAIAQPTPAPTTPALLSDGWRLPTESKQHVSADF